MANDFLPTANEIAQEAMRVAIDRLLALEVPFGFSSDDQYLDLIWNGQKEQLARDLASALGRFRWPYFPYLHRLKFSREFMTCLNVLCNGLYNLTGIPLVADRGEFGGSFITPATGALVVYPVSLGGYAHLGPSLRFLVSETDLGAAYATTIYIADCTLDTVLAIPDPGAATAQFVLTEGSTQTIAGSKTFTADITLQDANVELSASTGTRFGTGTDQKLAFYGATPIARPSAYTQTYSTADKTHAALTADMIGIVFIDSSPWGFASQAAANAFVANHNALRADLEDLKQLINSVVDDLQALGLVG